MPGYFWLVSARMKTSARNNIPYTHEALKQDLLRVRNAWDESQTRRERDAIYTYLTAVFELVAWWMAENRALERRQVCQSSFKAFSTIAFAGASVNALARAKA
jgi:hypothetical protein